MEIKQLEIIYKNIKNKAINEIAIEYKNSKIKIIKGENSSLNNEPEVITENIVTDNISKTSSISPEIEEKVDILSKDIGFFSRYNPKTKKQFVKLRDYVEKGEAVGNIKSMHIDHIVIAEKSGKITDFLVEEGQPVEYHQPLIRLETNLEK